MPNGNITTKLEACMFLSQIILESGGLKYKRELACLKDGCPDRYDHSVGILGQNYYGRGYIQLTHSYNYKAASLALYNDERLVKNPDLVADDEDAAWGTAFWYWAEKVHPKPGVEEGHFGLTTLAINGGLCKYSRYLAAAKHRFEIYKKVLIAVKLDVAPIETGCYN
jgi:predicted chitinase